MIPHHTNKTAPIIGLCWAPSGGDISLVQLEQNTTQLQYDGPVWTVGWKVLTDQGNQYQVSLTGNCYNAQVKHAHLQTLQTIRSII